ncbi:MAG: purine-binding chemotaxis protein CheW [Deltaproteobacteria bacterium]|nr:MAG: purine-binding chemotaxis protein CheW [Deltaproteobacteria bacterium]
MTDAMAVERSGAEASMRKFAAFYVGPGVYAVDIMRIKEVVQAREYVLRPVPRGPRIVEGVMQLRGVVIPVVDLRRRFGVEIDPARERLAKLIIVSVRGRIVALKTDQVIGEIRVPADELRPAPSLLREEGGGAFYSHVFNRGDTMVFVLNLEAIVDPTIDDPASAED